MTQSDRILRALRKGTVNTVDFAAPACDGGKPILRVAARIFELQRQGFLITTRRRSNRTTNYTLVREAEPAVESHQGSDVCPVSPGEAFDGSLGAPAHSESSPGRAPSPSVGAASELFDPAPYLERGGYRDAT